MKFKFDFEIMELEDEAVAVPMGEGSESFHGVLKLNDSARFILEQLREDTSEEKIVDAILAEFEGEREQIAEYVCGFVTSLRDADLLI